MTTKSKIPTAQAATSAVPDAPRKPTHRLYRVNGDGDGALCTPIGAA